MVTWSELEPPLLFAHRGANRERPENTLPAFELALELGADVLELDVHATRDGVFVVSHDPTGERMCGVTRAIAEASWAEVATWDAGVGFTDPGGAKRFAGAGIHPSRFEDVLDALPHAVLNVDVKDASQRELELLLALIRARSAEPRVLLTSFLGPVIDRIRGLRYSGPIGLCRRDVFRLVFTPSAVSRRWPLAGQRAQIPTNFGPFDLAAPRLLEKCRRLGLAVDYWVVNEQNEAAHLLARGASGLISDDTRLMAQVFRTAPETAAWRARRAKPG